MGYAYYFLISLVDIPDSLKKLNIDQLDEVLDNKYRKLFKQTYDQCKNIDWFPNFGEDDSSSAGGYGTGINENFYKVIGYLTQNHPEFTFGIYLFYWDRTIVEYIEIKNNQVLKYIEGPRFDTDPLKYPQIGLTLNIRMNSDMTNVKNNITEYFNPKYINPFETAFEFNK